MPIQIYVSFRSMGIFGQIYQLQDQVDQLLILCHYFVVFNNFCYKTFFFIAVHILSVIDKHFISK